MSQTEHCTDTVKSISVHKNQMSALLLLPLSVHKNQMSALLLLPLSVHQKPKVCAVAIATFCSQKPNVCAAAFVTFCSQKPNVCAVAIATKTTLAICSSVSLFLKVLFFCILAVTMYSSDFVQWIFVHCSSQNHDISSNLNVTHRYNTP